MRNTHCQIGGVDVLAARARSAVGIDANIRLRNLHIDIVIDDRINPDAGKGRMTAGVGIIGEIRTRRWTPDSVFIMPYELCP